MRMTNSEGSYAVKISNGEERKEERIEFYSRSALMREVQAR